MLKITVPQFELFDERTQEFIYCKGGELSLEHSLVSISKWESKWHKSYLSRFTEKTQEEVLDYIRCMTLTQNVDPNIYLGLTTANGEAIKKYIEDPHTATTFVQEEGKAPNYKVITSEQIYGQMVVLRIPFECQKWHINRLLTLIQVCNEYNKGEQKMTKAQSMAAHRAINASRRKPKKR